MESGAHHRLAGSKSQKSSCLPVIPTTEALGLKAHVTFLLSILLGCWEYEHGSHVLQQVFLATERVSSPRCLFFKILSSQ